MQLQLEKTTATVSALEELSDPENGAEQEFDWLDACASLRACRSEIGRKSWDGPDTRCMRRKSMSRGRS
jgi:hypothetical protein